MNSRNTCADCNQPCHKNAIRCLACYRKHRPWNGVCIDCGGRTSEAQFKRCYPCHLIARKRGLVDMGFLRDFNPAAFRELIEREDMEWPPEELARRSGVEVTAIRRWLSGARHPMRTEWSMVATVLALEPCGHCSGTGTIDPMAPDIEAVTRSVRRHGVVLPKSEPPLRGDGWMLDRNTWLLKVDQNEVPISRQESRIISTLAVSGGASMKIDQISSALGNAGKGPAPHAVHTYLTRLRDKCEAAGVDFGRVIQNSYGHGYRAVMPAAQEAAS